MEVNPVTDVVKVEIDLTPTEAADLYREVNSISGMTSLTADELNSTYPTASKLLNSLNPFALTQLGTSNQTDNGVTVPQP